MIKILAQDTIVDVVNKINNCEDKEIILEFPFSHPILHNYMSLKILKSKAWNKRITIVTNDLISKKIWNSIWINYSMVKDWDYIKEKNLKQELLKHNFWFFEYLRYELKKYVIRFINFIGKKTGINTLKYYNPYDKVKKSWAMLLIFWLFTSIWMLAFIFYFAVNKTYIEIQPEIKIKTNAINIIYEEVKPNETQSIWKDLRVPIKKITQRANMSYTYKTTWVDYENTARSKAEVTFYNELKDEQTFRPKTRLMTKDWLIFETISWVKIPWKWYNASWSLVPWSTKAEILARIYDTDWAFIWKRWNIKDAIFTIPWLKFNQDKIYAKLEWEAKWWTDNISYLVWDNDIQNAKQIFEETLKKEALKKLKEKIDNENKANNVNYEIVWIKDIINYNSLDIKTVWWDKKIWDKIDKFELTWSINIETYVYNKNNVINILRNSINDSLLSGTDKLMFVDENSLRISLVLEKLKNTPLVFKATTEVDVWISFDFDNNSNYYNQRLKTLILWLDNTQATNILLNDENISNVSIKNTPFFIKKVSSNIDNIIMKIKEQ